MEKAIKITGMHCQACKSLISMELEENGLAQKVNSIELSSQNTGLILLSDTNDQDVEKIVSIINKMDNYQVIGTTND